MVMNPSPRNGPEYRMPKMSCYPPFQCRTMKKATLASLYFPDDNVETAKQHLRRWMAYCKPLTEELRSMGYNPSLHSFMKREVEVIVKHLGEP